MKLVFITYFSSAVNSSETVTSLEGAFKMFLIPPRSSVCFCFLEKGRWNGDRHNPTPESEGVGAKNMAL